MVKNVNAGMFVTDKINELEPLSGAKNARERNRLASLSSKPSSQAVNTSPLAILPNHL
tara:strand:+ start:12089 stop:12262 length:174 start_codon:yes stop_codon:yes gene_type:complete